MREHESITGLNCAACGTLVSLCWFILSVCEFGPTLVVVSSLGWSLSPGWDPRGWMGKLSWLHSESVGPLLKPLFVQGG